MPNALYNGGEVGLMKDVDLAADTIKLALVGSAYTPNVHTHEDFAHITGEVSATGYTAGGATLASKTVTKDYTNDRAAFDAADVVWTISGTMTARGAVLYKFTGTASTSTLLAYYDFGSDKTAENGDFTVQINANGLLLLG